MTQPGKTVIGWGSSACITAELENEPELGDLFPRGLLVHVQITTLKRSTASAVPLVIVATQPPRCIGYDFQRNTH